MKTSETLSEITKALVAVALEIKNPDKNATNPHFKSKYADLPEIIECSRTLLAKYGIVCIQSATAEGSAVTVHSRMMHVSGEWVEDSLTMVAKDSGPQGIGSCITYGRRYLLASQVNVAAEPDDDGEMAEARSHHKPAPPPKQTYREPDGALPTRLKSGETEEEAKGRHAKGIFAKCKEVGLSDDDRKRFMLLEFGSDSSKNLTLDQMFKFHKALYNPDAVDDMKVPS